MLPTPPASTQCPREGTPRTVAPEMTPWSTGRDTPSWNYPVCVSSSRLCSDVPGFVHRSLVSFGTPRDSFIISHCPPCPTGGTSWSASPLRHRPAEDTTLAGCPEDKGGSDKEPEKTLLLGWKQWGRHWRASRGLSSSGVLTKADSWGDTVGKGGVP